ncbi:MAG TPA: response regulator transcription factor [Caulobacteraceae bacterium]|jgi:DNA-binding NarL/FixJ family response regulator
MKTCLVCDDHVLVREALAGAVRLAWPQAQITEVGDFPSAWAEAAKGHALCIADLMMPGAGPLAGIDGIMQAAPGMPVLIVTGTEDDALLLDLLDRGVAGFAPKTASSAIIEAALRLIAVGGRYLPQRLADIAASRIDTGGTPPQRDAAAMLCERLTDRQLDVLRLVAEGRSNKEIARTLDLAPSTVKTHLAHVLDCLNASNRTEASVKARMLNLL